MLFDSEEAFATGFVSLDEVVPFVGVMLPSVELEEEVVFPDVEFV